VAVVSVKVSPQVREKMKAYSAIVNWPEEIRKSIVAKIEEVERIRVVEETVKLLETVTPTPRGTAQALVREDRDRH
jgi:hypothetical protein